jgi:ABC-type glycerol-3-phosphate transport system substrate-binding protein
MFAGVMAAHVLAAAGCGASPGGGSAPGTRVHLTYAPWDPVQEAGCKKSVALFEKLHPGISVTVEQIPYPDYEPKPTSEFTSGSGPDVFWVNYRTDLRPAWLGTERVARAVAAATKDADTELQHPSQQRGAAQPGATSKTA